MRKETHVIILFIISHWSAPADISLFFRAEWKFIIVTHSEFILNSVILSKIAAAFFFFFVKSAAMKWWNNKTEKLATSR